MNSNLVSTAWLAENLSARNVTIIDASWHLPTAKRDAKAEFAAKHIPGARFYDLDAGADPTTTLPHMLPSAGKFAGDMAALGVSNQTHVIVYDSIGLFSAARLWWMLRSFGHDKVSVLDGGLKKWEADGRVVSSVVAGSTSVSFEAQLDATKIQNLSGVAKALSSGSAQIADARSGPRFRGEEPEPRPGVRPGHMPGALNVHYASLLNADGTLKSKPELRAAFETAGINLAKPIITSCGSGVTAAILILALEELGHRDHALYDGSWAEWGASGEVVVVRA
jgi:thiosulfate/3-mercaptopyruvate sulfurtransferase